MRSKDVQIGMKVVPTNKSIGHHSLDRVFSDMRKNSCLYLIVNRWVKNDKCYELKLPAYPTFYWYFKASEFEEFLDVYRRG